MFIGRHRSKADKIAARMVRDEIELSGRATPTQATIERLATEHGLVLESLRYAVERRVAVVVAEGVPE